MKLSSGEKDGLSWTESSMPTQASPQPVRRNQPQQSEAEAADRIECPRCKSRNTKFCYYNNYNKSQPRHYCKCCKRHWTKGGTLRTVPVGGGRRYKKFKSSSLATIPANSLFQASSTSQQKGIPINGFSVERSFPESLTCLSTEENKKFSISSSVGVFDNTVSSSTNYNSDEIKVISYGGMKNDDTTVESTISTISTSAYSQPWVGPTNSATMEVPSYWNWNDIDNLISGDLDATWGDYEDIKF